MPNDWSQKKCVPCEGGVPKLSKQEAAKHMGDISGWQLSSSGDQISVNYRMKNFVAAVQFIKSIADVAERENHHPDLHLTGYRNLRVDLSTHAIGGLSENDFIVAAKINQLPKELKTI